ncbi:MAG: Lpg1974 family pore-forming outer membrane protein [Chlamydiota bacterium]
MAKWNKKLGLVFLNLGLLTMTPNFANADSCYDPCCDPCSFGGFEIGADFLYWKPCVDNMDYAVVRYSDTTEGTSPTTTTSKWGYKCLCLDWEPGFRIRFGKDDIWCNWRLNASYTWLDVNTSATCKVPDNADYVTSPFFHPNFRFLQDPEFSDLTVVKGTYDTTYQTWDVLLAYDIACNRCHSFQPFFGVEGLILDQGITASGFVTEDISDVDFYKTKWTSDFFGVGLKIGSDYQFQMFDCVKFYGSAAGTITVGDFDGKYTGYVVNASGEISKSIFADGDCCRVVPGYHLAAGLLYETDACGCEFAIRLGWEFVQWHNVANPRAFSSALPLDEHYSSSTDYTTLGFHGLVAGLDFSF